LFSAPVSTKGIERVVTLSNAAYPGGLRVALVSRRATSSDTAFGMFRGTNRRRTFVMFSPEIAAAVSSTRKLAMPLASVLLDPGEAAETVIFAVSS